MALCLALILLGLLGAIYHPHPRFPIERYLR